MRVHFVVHEEYEAPGACKVWAESRNHELLFTHLRNGDTFPESSDSFDMLIVMGGPQSPATTTEECPHFSAQKEKLFILAAIKAKKAVVGICLGAQLVGEALGASYEHSPEREIGKFPITLSEYGQKNPKFAHLDRVLWVGHWHDDMPGLTPEAKIIASSEGCPRQIVEYSPTTYGLQCHMELNLDVVNMLIGNSDLSEHAKYKFVDSAEKLRSHDYQEMNNYLFGFLDKLQSEIEAS